MYKRTALLAMLLALSLTCYGQNTWSYLYEPFGHTDSGYYPTNMVKANDGGYVVGGYYVNAPGPWGGEDIYSTFTMKFDADGNLLWHNLEYEYAGYGGNCESLIALPQGGYASLVEQFSLSFVLIYDENGVLLNQIPNTDFDMEFNSIYPDVDSGFIVCGYTHDFVATLCKLTTQGDLVWQRTYTVAPDAMQSGIMALKHTPDNGFICTGYKTDPNYVSSAVFMKLDASFDSVWITTTSSPGRRINSIAEDFSYEKYYFCAYGSIAITSFAGELLQDFTNLNLFIPTLTMLPDGSLVGRADRWYYGFDTDLNQIWSSNTETGFDLGKCKSHGQAFVVESNGYLVTMGQDYTTKAIRLTKTNFIGMVPTQDNVITPALATLSNYPNPFNPVTTISFSLPNTLTNPVLQVYNLKGQLVRQLGISQAQQQAGSLSFNAANQPSGVYLYRVKANKFATSVKKMTIIK